MDGKLTEYAITFFLSFLPISELRGAIPYGILSQRLPLHCVLVLSLIGNFLPVVPVYLGIQQWARCLSRNRLAKRFFDWVFARTRRQAKSIQYSEFFGLAIFVGVPLPMTGAWTGAILGSLLGISPRRGIPAILLGILIAAGVVTGVCLGVITVFDFFIKR